MPVLEDKFRATVTLFEVSTIGKARKNNPSYLCTQDNDSENGTKTVNKRGLSPTD
jgi:hypothetical protein